MTRDQLASTISDWFCWVSAPLLAVYAIGLYALPAQGYEWHPWATIAQGFIAPVTAALASGYFFRKVQP